MESILLVVHVVIALVIVGLIMLQQGKGAEMGASFGGGGSQTVFGAAGSGNFFSRMTAILVAVFFVTSFVLAMMAKSSVGMDESIVPYLEETSEAAVPAASSADAVPTMDNEADDAAADLGEDVVPQSE